MFRKVCAGILITSVLASRAWAANDLGPTTEANPNNAATLTTLQPASPTSLQPTGTLQASDNTDGTGAGALQPAGDKQAALDFIGSDIDGEPVENSTPISNDVQNGALLGLSALVFLVTAFIIFRTSKRIEALEAASKAPASTVDSSDPVSVDESAETEAPARIDADKA